MTKELFDILKMQVCGYYNVEIISQIINNFVLNHFDNLNILTKNQPFLYSLPNNRSRNLRLIVNFVPFFKITT
jgi:hypothetical protein